MRIELYPQALNKYNIGLEDVRSVQSGANANTPKGFFSDGERTHEVGAVSILTNRMLANVLLVEALSGGRDTSELPSPQ